MNVDGVSGNPSVAADTAVVLSRATDQAGTDLTRQADALSFSAGQRRRRAIESEIMQSDIEKESQPSANFLQQLAGNNPMSWS